MQKNLLKPLPVLASVSNTAVGAGSGAAAETDEDVHGSCLTPCLIAGASSKGNFATCKKLTV